MHATGKGSTHACLINIYLSNKIVGASCESVRSPWTKTND